MIARHRKKKQNRNIYIDICLSRTYTTITTDKADPDRPKHTYMYTPNSRTNIRRTQKSIQLPHYTNKIEILNLISTRLHLPQPQNNCTERRRTASKMDERRSTRGAVDDPKLLPTFLPPHPRNSNSDPPRSSSSDVFAFTQENQGGIHNNDNDNKSTNEVIINYRARYVRLTKAAKNATYGTTKN